MSTKWPLQSMAFVIGPCWTNFCSQKLKRRILATFDFNRTALRTKATLYILSPVFEDRINSCRADVVWPSRSCDLTPFDYYLWRAVKDKCNADKPETIDTLKYNILEAIGEIQLHTIDNVLKIGPSCRLLHGQPRQPFDWNYFPLLTGRIVLSNKKRNLRQYSEVFSKKKVFGGSITSN